MKLCVQADDTPNVSDLINVEILQPSRKFRVCNSENKLFSFILIIYLLCQLENHLEKSSTLGSLVSLTLKLHQFCLPDDKTIITE